MACRPVTTAALLVAIALAACGSPETASGPADPSPSAGTASSTTPTPSTAPSPASDPAQAERPGGLPGTTWEFTGLTLTFYDGGKVQVKGGVLGDGGLEGTYSLDGNNLQFDVGGQQYTGTYTDGTLTIDGGEAKRLN